LNVSKYVDDSGGLSVGHVYLRDENGVTRIDCLIRFRIFKPVLQYNINNLKSDEAESITFLAGEISAALKSGGKYLRLPLVEEMP
jgi:hypothetical protein